MPDPQQEELLAELARALAAGTFVKLTLGKSRVPDAHQASIRLIDVRGEPHVAITLHERTRDLATNHPIGRAAEVVRGLLASHFGNAHLFTTAADLELRTGRRGDARLLRRAPSFQAAPSREHDRKRNYLLDPAAPWMHALGLVGEAGRPRGDLAAKYRQLQNLIGIVDELARKAELARSPPVRVVDIGCGKGYLAFALHDFFSRRLGVEVEVVGVDRDAGLVAEANRVATRVRCAGLRFACAPAGSYPLGPGPLAILAALHACDTATDDAIYKGIEAGAAVILTVPCCQKEVRPQLAVPPEERALLRHDTFKDRFAQMLTDALRALLLESQGYRARVSEFISDAHTHRNVLIAGVRDAAPRQRTDRLRDALALAARYGVAHQRLEGLLRAAGRLDEAGGGDAKGSPCAGEPA